MVPKHAIAVLCLIIAWDNSFCCMVIYCLVFCSSTRRGVPLTVIHIFKAIIWTVFHFKFIVILLMQHISELWIAFHFQITNNNNKTTTTNHYYLWLKDWALKFSFLMKKWASIKSLLVTTFLVYALLAESIMSYEGTIHAWFCILNPSEINNLII